MPPAACLKAIVRQVVPSAFGFTQASSVIPAVRSSEAESGTVIQFVGAVEGEREPPDLPVVDQVAPEMVPAFPLPDASGTVAPVPVSNE